MGAAIDSAADIVFIAAVFAVFSPMLAWEGWMLGWIAAIIAIRLASLAVGFAKYRALAFLHTYANKAAGGLLFGFPLLYGAVGLAWTAAILCGAATVSAVEELTITIRSKALDRDARGLFDR